MKKTGIIKKISMLFAAACLVMPMSTSAFADEPIDGNNTYTGRTGVFITDSTTVTFRKDIVLKNNGADYVYSPAINYTYTVAPVENFRLNDATVTDSDGAEITVNAGLEGGVTMIAGSDTANFTTERVALSNGTATVSKDIKASINMDVFEANKNAGIFRYVINEQVDKNELTSQGITRGSNYNEARYLDVYISNVTDETSPNTLKVSGYVIFAAADPSKIINSYESTADTIIGKTEGFVDKAEHSDGGEATSSLADTYYTYNLTVNVDILGNLAEEEHLFPVVISTDAGTGLNGRTFDYYVTVNKAKTDFEGFAAEGVLNPGGQIGTDIETALAKGDSILLCGLPANTGFNITETNNTGQTYKISVKSGDITLSGKSAVKVEDGQTITAFDPSDSKDALSSYVDYTTQGHTAKYETITFTNTLNDMSLTGVILRSAPYAIILGAAMLLAVILIKNKREKATGDVL